MKIHRTGSARRPHTASVFRPALAACLAAAAISGPAVGPAAADEPPEVRVQIALKSADEILGDLQTVVGRLAGESDAYEELIYPNLDIFLVGVDTGRTIRFDLIQPSEGESRLNMAIPLSDTKDFLRDNIEPIGIDYKRRSDSYYELDGDVYEGYLRIVDGYAVIAKKPYRGDAAEGMESPAAADSRLFARPADMAILIDAASGTAKQRRAVAEAKGQSRVEQLVRRDDETEAAFELRRTMAANRAEQLPKILGGLKRMLLGYETVASSGTGRSHLIVEAEEDTELRELIEGVGTQSFLFAGVPTDEDPIYTGRLAWPMTQARKDRWTETIEASRAVAANQLDTQDPPVSEERRAAQGELTDAVYDFLKANVDQPLLGVFAEVRKADGKTYSAAGGVQSVDGTALVAVLEKIPAAIEGAKLEPGIETFAAGGDTDVTLHRLTMPSMSQPLQDFFGGDSVTVGTASNAVYVAGGPDGVALLKRSIETLEPAETPSVLTLRAHLGPMARLLDSVMTRRDISLIQFMQQRREERLETRKDAAEARRLQVTDPAAWREAALEALLGKPDDVLTVDLKKVEDRLEGETTLGTSILAAVGELIAKFAKENL